MCFFVFGRAVVVEVWVLGVTASLVAGDTASAQPRVVAPATDDFQAVGWVWFQVSGGLRRRRRRFAAPAE